MVAKMKVVQHQSDLIEGNCVFYLRLYFAFGFVLTTSCFVLSIRNPALNERRNQNVVSAPTPSAGIS